MRGDGAAEEPGAGCVVAPERCDGRDNDCDGDVDEAAELAARGVIGGACGTPGDVCSQGVLSCVGGGLSCVPVVVLREEGCNGADDDCDGQVDEGFDLGRRCGVGVGQCRGEGVTVCSEIGDRTECGAVLAPAADELCDDLDNDCDGTVDESVPVGGQCVVGRGECTRTGALICAPGGATVCDAEPGRPAQRDVCNGRDDDCDGGLDEEFDVGAPCWVGEGQCEREGTVRCTAAAAGACDARVGIGSAELCNSLDDDCDGATDEEFNLAQPCSLGVGRCRAQGVWVCSADGAAERCDGEPSLGGQPESCNGLDDDCDGGVDETFDLGAPCAVGVGECRREAERVCGDGPFTVCPAVPGRPSGSELCDGLDDDCDASTDEGFDVGGFCRVGTGACVQVGARRCAANRREVECDVVPLPPTAETCNDVDDDCDGNTDEPEPALGFPLEAGVDPETGTLLRSHDDGSFLVAVLAGDALSVASVDCAWSVAWRVTLPNSAAPLAIADALDAGVVVLEGDVDRSLVSVGREGPRWRLNLGPAAQIGGMASGGGGYAVVVRDQVQLLDAEGRQAGRWPHGAPAAADGTPTVPAITEGPDGDFLLHWTDPASGDAMVLRTTPTGELVSVTVASGGGAALTPRVHAVGEDGAILLTGILRDAAGEAAWLGIIDSAGALQVQRGSPFYQGCVAGAFASGAADPVLRCVAPQRVLFLQPAGDVRRSINVVTAAMAPDPFGARGVVLLASPGAAGLTFTRLLRPE